MCQTAGTRSCRPIGFELDAVHCQALQKTKLIGIRIQAEKGRDAGTSRTCYQRIAGPTYRDNQPFTLQFRFYQSLSAYFWQEEAVLPGENLRRHE